MTACWDKDPKMRPTFSQALEMLEAIYHELTKVLSSNLIESDDLISG